MARSTGSGAVEAIQRQVCRVRRRRNLRELQRALYLLIAVGTGGATALVLLALTASPRLFARAVAAASGLTLLALIVALAPRLRPQAPEVVAGEVSAPALDAVDLSVERLAVDEDIAGMPGAGPDEGPAAAGLQERIRRELWGAPAPASSVPVRRSAHVREEAPADAAGDDALEAA